MRILHILIHLHPTARVPADMAVATENGREVISFWSQAKLGTRPAWDDASGTYPALEAHRAAAEAAEAAKQAEAVADAAEREVIRNILAALKAGTGTAGERLSRIERVLFHVAKKVLLQ